MLAEGLGDGGLDRDRADPAIGLLVGARPPGPPGPVPKPASRPSRIMRRTGDLGNGYGATYAGKQNKREQDRQTVFNETEKRKMRQKVEGEKLRDWIRGRERGRGIELH